MFFVFALETFRESAVSPDRYDLYATQEGARSALQKVADERGGVVEPGHYDYMPYQLRIAGWFLRVVRVGVNE